MIEYKHEKYTDFSRLLLSKEYEEPYSENSVLQTSFSNPTFSLIPLWPYFSLHILCFCTEFSRYYP